MIFSLYITGCLLLCVTGTEFDHDRYQNETGCELYPLENGYYRNISHPLLGTVVQGICSLGYMLEGPQYRACNIKTGQLDGNESICTGCELSALVNGTYLDISSPYLGLAVQVMCSAGYRLRGSPVRVCNLTTGNWANPDNDNTARIAKDPFCEDIDECQPIKSQEDSSEFSWEDDVTSGGPCHENAQCSNTDGSYVCSCDEGYLGDGVQCRAKKDCAFLPDPLNGRVILIGKRARYECDPRYRLYGPQFRHCGRQTWYPAFQPFCAPRDDICPALPDLENGKRLGNSVEIGARVRYICVSGYELVGPQERDCTAGRVWTGYDPICESRKSVADIAVALKREVTKLGSASSTSPHARLGKKTASGVDLVFLIDRSSSITEKNFEKSKAFIKNIIREFGVDNAKKKEGGTRIALITFGSQVRMVFNLNDTSINSLRRVEKKLKKIKGGGGGTALRQALEVVFIRVAPLARPAAQKAIFILADGQSNVGDAPDPTHIAKSLRETKKLRVERMTKHVSLKTEFVFTRPTSTRYRLAAEMTLLRSSFYAKTGALTEALLDFGFAHFINDQGVCLTELHEFEIFAVGVGKLVERAELRKVASQSYSAHVFVLSKFADLDVLQELIVQDKSVNTTCGFAGEIYDREKGYRRNYGSKKGAWPWLARIQDENAGTVCGGSLICRRWVLTSVQCLKNLSVPNTNVDLGLHDITEEVGQTLSVKDFHVHPRSNNGDYYNVALIELSDAANISRLVHPVCLTNDPGKLSEYTLTSRSGNLLRVAGWGIRPMLPGKLADSWDKPKDMRLPVVHAKTCIESFSDVKFTHDMFCLGQRYDNETACKGDIGGAAVYKHNDRFVAVALAQRTKDCYHKNKYGLFTKITSPEVAGWIQSVTQNCNLALQKGVPK